MNLTKRFSIFGVFLMWSALIPLYLTLFSQNTFSQLLGMLMLLGWHIVFVRCSDLALMFVMIEKTSSVWVSAPIAVTWFIGVLWVLWHGNDVRVFFWVWVFSATAATLRMLIEVDIINPGERA